MKQLFTLVILLSFALVSIGQCSIDIPANAIVVTALGAPTVANGQFIWVCAGAVTGVQGNNNTIVVEDQGSGSATGDNNILITKSSGTYISGSNNSVFIPDPTLVADLGTNTMITTCPVVTFNYANAPSAGCMTIGINEIEGVQLELFPNPIGDELTISMDNAQIEHVSIYDLQGRIVLESGTIALTIDVSKIPPGMYMLVVGTDKGRIARMVQKA